MLLEIDYYIIVSLFKHFNDVCESGALEREGKKIQLHF